MARSKLNLNLATLDRGTSVLIHGGYNVGKTHLAGDFLSTLATEGPVKFINVRGEDGYLTLASFGLGEIGETAEDHADLIGIIDELARLPVVALAVDSLAPINKLVQAKTIGTDTRSVQKTEWGDVHFEMSRLVTSLKRAARFVLVTCPSDKSINQLDGRTYITPDLPGREAAGSAGWFDFVGYLSADVTGPGQMRRRLTFAPNAQIVTRARTPKPVADIELPNGKGGWAKARAAIQAAMTVTPTPNTKENSK